MVTRSDFGVPTGLATRFCTPFRSMGMGRVTWRMFLIFITDGRWEISDEFSEAFPDIADRIRQVPLPIRDVEDTLIWPFSSTDDLSFRDAYIFLRPSAPVLWARHLWGLHIPPRISIFVWRLLHGHLATQNLLQLYDRYIANRCPLCESSS